MGDFGLVVSGGPAPGINSVIASVVVQAESRGFKVKGFREGFRGIIEQGQSSVVELSVDSVLPTANAGGSILGTSRHNPFFDINSKRKFFEIIENNNIDKLVVIGGEGSAYICHNISQQKPLIRVAHIPKAIDNDLFLPNKHPSFGFETARQHGTEVMSALITEARTTNRWFIVRTMGRRAGFLALGLGIASGATITLIPEQFDEKLITPRDVAELIFSSMQSRLRQGQQYGTAVIAEGIIDRLDPERVPEIRDCPRDEVGRIRFSEIKLEDLIATALRQLLIDANLEVKVTSQNIGYTLRAGDPLSFDIEYTRLLGYGAVKYLLEGFGGITVVRDFDNLAFVPLINMVDEDGRIHSRSVDLTSDMFRVATSFMVK